MTGLIIKVFAFPLVIFLSDYFLPAIRYTSLYQPVFIGIALALVAHMLEKVILKRGTLWLSTIADFLIALPIIYFSQFLFPHSLITWTGAALAAFLLSLAEILVHLFLIYTGRVSND